MMAARYYTGVGARSTPPTVLAEMRSLAVELAGLGCTLRSGGAPGADEAFEQAVRDTPDAKAEIFTPWKGFIDRPSTADVIVYDDVWMSAMAEAEKYHPNWKNLGLAVWKLHARNVHEVVGPGDAWPKPPLSRFTVCWTPDGAERETTAKTGGTGQAIRVSVGHAVPVINMARAGWRARVEGYCNG